MILDILGNGPLYRALHRGFDEAFAFLLNTDLAALTDGRHDIAPGGAVFALVMGGEGRGQEAARLEAHRKAIDIQVTVSGVEIIGWSPLGSCLGSEGYSPDEDLEFFRDAPVNWLTVPVGGFAVFLPGDAHAPLAGTGPVRKVVVKVAVS